MKKLFAIAMAVAVLFTLAACGGDEKKDSGDPNLIKLGKYEALYTSHEILKDSDGNDAIAIHLTYTNKSDKSEAFDWSFFYTAYQNGEELEYAVIFVSEDSFDTLGEDNYTEVDPGKSLDVTLTYTLKDLSTDVVVEFTPLLGEEKDSLTIKLG